MLPAVDACSERSMKNSATCESSRSATRVSLGEDVTTSSRLMPEARGPTLGLSLGEALDLGPSIGEAARPDAQDQTDRDECREHRGTTGAHQRQGQALDGEKTRHHPDIVNNLEGECG